MKGQILAVDFENKKLLKDTQQKSDKKTNKHYFNHTQVCDGNVTIYQTAKSGGVWQMRMRIEGHRKYFQKSLRTKDKTSAIEKKQAKEEAIFERAIENDNKGKTEKGLVTIGRQQIDYLSEENIEEAMLKEGYLKTYEERTKRKRYIRTHTHRLLAKAEANIKEVGKGRFGVGH